MQDIENLMAAACAFVDIIGCYSSQFTPEQRKRAASKRTEIVATSAKPTDETVDRAAALRGRKMQEEQVCIPGGYDCLLGQYQRSARGNIRRTHHMLRTTARTCT